MFKKPKPKVPRALIRIDEKRIVEGFVTSLSSREIVARYVAVPPLALALGSRISLSLHRNDERSVHEARVIGRSEQEEEVEYRFEAAGDESFTASSERNQRIALRVELGAIWPLETEIRPFDEDPEEVEVEPVIARVVDLSRTGFGVDVPLEAEEALCEHELVHVRFELAGAELPLEFAASIRQRRIQGVTLRYGIQFEEALTPDFDEQAALVESFVRRRRVDLSRSHLKRNAG